MQLREAVAAFLLVEAKTRRERTLAATERKLSKAIAKAFKAQRSAFLRQLPAEESRSVQRVGSGEWRIREAVANPWEDWGDWENWLTAAIAASAPDVEAILGSTLLEALQSGYAVAVADLVLDYAFDLKNPRAVAWAEAHAAELVTQIAETTRESLRSIITRGIGNGDSYQAIAAEIRDAWAFSEERALLIATYETGVAYEQGNLEVAQSLLDHGQEMEKSWLSAGDDRVDEEDCAPNEDEGWIPLAQAFQSGHDIAPAHPGCRCTTLYRRAEEE